jgi:hypothetical protein
MRRRASRSEVMSTIVDTKMSAPGGIARKHIAHLDGGTGATEQRWPQLPAPCLNEKARRCRALAGALKHPPLIQRIPPIRRRIY